MWVKTTKVYGIVLLFSMLLIGCGNNRTPDVIATMIDVSYPASREVPTGSGIEIQLTNESEYCVIFPVVTGMTIYTVENGEEIKVGNLVVVMGDENVPLGPKDEIFSMRQISIVPDTTGLSISKPTQFFARLTGYLCDDESVKIIKEIPFTVIP
ncbi:MAG TPA: hypothetical protein PK530_25320 [Anaerolineales bacterium]|nr:hypothetical protein [Anaerolineales bacterium]